ncbi:hypothetical protein BDZ91DRAFT_791347 [Kalaharituber pfeilii]|nr:hypothetical protein BDZ91DRAFT_791347 [Kalaharituber pfeilii]
MRDTKGKRQLMHAEHVGQVEVGNDVRDAAEGAVEAVVKEDVGGSVGDERGLERGLGEMEEAVGWLVSVGGRSSEVPRLCTIGTDLLSLKWDAAISRDAQVRDIELGVLFGSEPGRGLFGILLHTMDYNALVAYD